jgi:thiol-disulfide isomerase/thioredoxin
MRARRLALALLAGLTACAGAPEPPPPVTIEASPPGPVVPPPPAPSYVLEGKLLGHDGAPMKLAHVHLGDRALVAGADGAFHVKVRGPGFVPVSFTGVDHRQHTVGVFFDGQPIALEVKLGTYEREGPGAEPRLVVFTRGEAGGAPQERREVRLARRPDGVLEAQLEVAGEVLYEVRYVARGRAVNGPQADGFEYDGDGDYLSVLRGPGPLTVRLDPGALPPPGRATVTRFRDAGSRAARIAAVHEAAALRVAQATEGDAFRGPLLAALAAETDPDVAAALRIAYFVPPPPAPLSEASRAVARALLAALGPDASLWSLRPEAVIPAAAAAGGRREDLAYVDRVFDGLRPPEVAARFLRARLLAAAHAGREDEVSRLYPLMTSRFGDTAVARATQFLDPSRQIRIGRPLPDFDLVALPDRPRTPAAHVTRQSLRGKVVLLDFWGTWCKPCVAEMGTLHEVHGKYRDRGFTIVSVAGNDTLDAVTRFREAGRFPMPWTNVVLGAAEMEATLRQFEVHSFPSPILIDGEGKVLNLGDELRGEELKRSVEAALAGR